MNVTTLPNKRKKMIYTVTFNIRNASGESRSVTCATTEHGYDLLRMTASTPHSAMLVSRILETLPDTVRKEIEEFCPEGPTISYPI